MIRRAAILALALLALPGLADADEATTETASHARARMGTGVDDALTLRARLAVPLVSAEAINDNHGTNVILGGSFGIDFGESLTLEAGASWLDVEHGAYDVFGRVGWFWELIDTRNEAAREGWQHGVASALGYRFLHDADEVEGTEGSTDVHAATGSVGWRSTKFWDGIGLEFRVFPTLSIGLAEESDGGWGEAAPSMDPLAAFQPAIVGNPEDFVWGLDLELTVGVAF